MRRYYRFVSKNEKFKTRWKLLGPEGTEPPSDIQKEKLGKGYSLQLIRRKNRR